jgi:hypothetical protein
MNIRQILDLYTEECKDCNCGNIEDCSETDCSFYYCREMRNEIMDVLEGESK